MTAVGAEQYTQWSGVSVDEATRCDDGVHSMSME